METGFLVSKADSPESVFALLAEQAGSVWLDSTLCFDDRGHHSFTAHQPVLDIALEDGRVIMRRPGEQLKILPGDRIWDELTNLWADRKYFSVGYISYEAMSGFLGMEPRRNETIPPVRFLFYPVVRRYDWKESDTIPVSDGYPGAVNSFAKFLTSRSDYLHAVRRIKNHIREGDIYQANFTTRIDVECDLAPFDVYRRVRSLNPSPYSAYLNFGDYRLLSTSPERMFLKQGKRITTGPIKGTTAAGADHTERFQNTKRLLSSAKDRAELLMIVDLERNDLGRVARTGSVRVDHLFRTEQYSSVIHLVSDISAELEEYVTMKDILQALLPGGSITGAPKKRAVEILAELETQPRSVYTGCIGYVYGDTADFNIAIRTMIYREGKYQVYAGGGIVADSDPGAEYDEMLLKARNLLRALGVQEGNTAC